MKELSLVKKKYIDYIDSIIERKTISHSYLVEVSNYDNDLSYVYDFIKMILCNIKYDEISVSDNSIIHLVDSNNYPDIKVIEPDGTFIKKGQVIDLQREFSNTSLLENKRIYIIKNCEKLNSSSANTILKFLEEPEPDIIAFLITDNRYHVLETIASRCQILTLREPDKVDGYDDEIIELLGVFKNPEDFFIKYNYFINNVIKDKIEAKAKFAIIEKICLDYLTHKRDDSYLFDERALAIFDNINEEKMIKQIAILEKELPKLNFNVNYKLWVDSLFSKFIIGG